METNELGYPDMKFRFRHVHVFALLFQTSLVRDPEFGVNKLPKINALPYSLVQSEKDRIALPSTEFFRDNGVLARKVLLTA